MEEMGLYIAIGVLVWILAAVYMAWRIRDSMKRRLSSPPELTWLIYLVVFTVAAPLIYVAGRVSRGAGLVALAVAFVISFSISYYALGRYRKWLAEQEAEDQEKQA